MAFFFYSACVCVWTTIPCSSNPMRRCQFVYLPVFPGVSLPFLFCNCICLSRLYRLGSADLLLAPAPTFTHLQLIVQLPPSAAAVDKHGSSSGSRLSENPELFGPEMRKLGFFVVSIRSQLDVISFPEEYRFKHYHFTSLIIYSSSILRPHITHTVCHITKKLLVQSTFFALHFLLLF